MLGPMLTLMGMKPVKFQSESDFEKSVSTTSKVFSIYAVGAVKGFKRETRVRIHTVVDFRNTEAITGSSLSGRNSQTAPGALPGQTGGQQVQTANSANGAINTALQPSVGGQVLYYEIE